MNVYDFFKDTYETPTVKADRYTIRPRNTRVPYLENHPRSDSTVRIIRDKHHNVLPSIVGMYPPRSDDTDKHQLYCASMLLLFRPWRHLETLKDDGTSWSDEFDEFCDEASPHTLNMMENIQYLHRSEAAAEEE